MNLLRGGAALVAFLVGLITLAGGLYSMALTLAAAAQPKHPINLPDLAGGMTVFAIGILFLFISRRIDPEHGPVRSYHQHSRKS